MLIGITGTNGAGKGAVVEYLVANKGFSRYAGRMVILEAIEARGLTPNRTTMRDVGNELRKEHGPAYIMERLYELTKDDTHAVLESVRTVAEAEFLKEKGAFLIAVDADKQTRYERVVSMSHDAVPLTVEQFTEMEDREMASSEPWDMNVFGVMQLSDARIENNGTVEELRAKVDEAIASFKQT
ncbi:MAG: AAA family ATPase [Bacillota bacterium]